MNPFRELDRVSKYYIIALLCVMFMSMRLLFTWPLPQFIIYLASFAVTLLFAITFRKNLRYVRPSVFVSLLLLILVFLYEILFVWELRVISLLVGLIVIINTGVLLLSGKEIAVSLFSCCDYILKIIIGVSLAGWILFLLGVPLPHFILRRMLFMNIQYIIFLY